MADMKGKLKPIDGQPPDLISPPKGCPFYARCDYAMKVCDMYMPEMTQISATQRTACWMLHEFAKTKRED